MGNDESERGTTKGRRGAGMGGGANGCCVGKKNVGVG